MEKNNSRQQQGKKRPKKFPANEKSSILNAATLAKNAAGASATAKNDSINMSTSSSTATTTVNMTDSAVGTSSTGPSSIEGDLTQLVEEIITENEQNKSSMAHTSFNYINSILGSGIIGMPYALQQAGFGLGLFLLVFVAIVTDYSLGLMIRNGHLSKSSSYQGVMEIAFGRVGLYLLTILQLIYPFIAMISYNVIVGDTLTKVLGYLSFSSSGNSSSEEGTMNLQREAVVFLATITITLPLSLYRNVARMSKVSFVSLISIGFILMAIIIRSRTIDLEPTPNAWKFANTGAIQALGIYAFAFMCHHNTFMIFGSMKNKNECNWNKVTHISIGTALIVSIIFSIFGYATFTGIVQGDLLENYCWNDTLINISRVMFAITIMLTFPLECFVVRDVIEQIFYKESQPASSARHFIITFGIVMMACVISMSTDCLGVTLELNGLLAAIPLAYIFPAICFIRLEPTKFLSIPKLKATATALFGILVSATGIILLIVNGSASKNCTHGEQLPYCSIPMSLSSNESSSLLPLPLPSLVPQNQSLFTNL